ncbi:MAG: type II methionyl aminopeptidase [Thermoplasmata archaeon]|nr:MAG: type II methionyl aminopeptidase [Thermoplasmata archaeon]KAA0012404.1 MAG: type II methionyl aminopeptidase [Thermoplasmata archaeon]RLF51172.1 MAG: type II methionyl aminopeptidase [Thermoplasmata archaeon]
MESTVLKKYRKAGKIAAEARDYGAGLIKAGARLLDIAEKVEKRIYELGGKPAFPVNISINRVAAHFSPKLDDVNLEIREGDVVKLDVGAHVDGYIADTALTVEVDGDKYDRLIRSSKIALERVIEHVKSGVEVGKIGEIVYESIKKEGFNPIENLSGHGLGRFKLHTGVSIPNIPTGSRRKLKEDEVVAIEPFASTGKGHVESKGWSNIYLYMHPPVLRDVRLKFLAKRLKEKFGSLPFADRWFVREFPNLKIGLEKLISLGCVYHYPRLVDDGIVSQHEHTIIVTEDGCEVIT